VVVGVKSQGADQTKEDLEGVTDQTEETTEALGEQSGEMTDMAQSFSGALSAATVGLAAASAGLLSQVPVLGEVFDGLFAILQSVALAMDQVLRPVLSPLANKMFELSEAVGKVADGPLGTIIGILGAVATVIATALLGPVGLLGSALAGLGVGALLALVNFSKFKKGLAKIAQFVQNKAPKAFNRFKEIVTNVISTAATKLKNNLPKILQALINIGQKIVDKVSKVVGNTNFNQLGRDVMNKIASAIKAFVGFVAPIVSDLIDVLEKEFEGYSWNQFGKDVVKLIATAISTSVTFVAGAADVLAQEIVDKIKETDWKQVGKDILKALANGIRAGISFVTGAIDQAAQEIDDHLPSSPAEKGPLSDIDKSGPGLVDTFASGITSNLGQLESAGNQAADAADGRGQGGSLPGGSSSSTKVFLNGREVGRGTNSERFDESARRGQTF